MMNALGAIGQGLQARELAFQGQAQEQYRNALGNFGMNAPQTRTAFAAVNPVAANALAARDQERRDQLLGQASRQLAGLPPEVQARVYPQVASQLKAAGVELGQFEAYPGPEAIQIAAMIYAMPAQERTEFERLIGSLPEADRAQALRVRLGLAPGADAVLRSGAESRDPIAALRARASEAGLRPGTPEYAQFMAQGGAGQTGLAIEMGPDGSMSVRQGPGAAQQRPFTEGQSKDNVYTTRATGALATLDRLAPALANFGDKVMDADPTGLVRGNFQSPEYQVARTAADEFLQAILRKDTGAAITSQEQELYGRTYLPQPGDGPEQLAYKTQARQRAIAAMRAGMSPAQMIAVEKGLSESTPDAVRRPDPVQQKLQALDNETLLRLLQGSP